jgi:hypothetical protein
MVTTASHATVAAPVDAVWQALTAYGDIGRWASSVDHSSLLTDGPVGPGSVRRIQSGRTVLRETITRWEPGSALGYDIAGLPAVITAASNTWTLAADGAGTAITLTGEVETRGGPVVARLVSRRFATIGDQLVRGLAEHLRR